MIPMLAVALALSPLQNEDLADMRPEARRLAEAARANPGGVTVDEVLGHWFSRPEVGAPPATIRVWRRRVDGSSDSCAGRVDVIPFEDYVKGVLPHEWLMSWDDRSLEMGALCIRSFAWAWIRAGGKYDCADLDDTTASQVYKDDRNARASAAVDRTRGVVIARNGSVVMAEYSAENSSPTKFGVDEPHCDGKELFGHGRGACQWGTQRWATKEGKDFHWMVPHYYPGAAVHGAAPAWRNDVVDLDVPPELTAGQEGTVSVELENTGAAAWDGTVRLAASAPSPFFKEGAWLDASHPVALSAVPPGGRLRVSFPVLAPEVATAEIVEEHLELVRDGSSFGVEGAVTLAIRVNPRAAGPVTPPLPQGDDAGDDEARLDATGGCQVGAGGAGGAGGRGGALVVLMALRLALARRTGGRTRRG